MVGLGENPEAEILPWSYGREVEDSNGPAGNQLSGLGWRIKV